MSHTITAGETMPEDRSGGNGPTWAWVAATAIALVGVFFTLWLAAMSSSQKRQEESQKDILARLEGLTRLEVKVSDVVRRLDKIEDRYDALRPPAPPGKRAE